MRSVWDHSWGVVSDGHVVCRSGGDTQGVANFVEAARLTAHHDERLAGLTKQVNQLLEQHRSHDDGRQLAFITTPDGIMLAWTRNEHDKTWAEESGDVVNADSPENEVREALGLA
jgi:hypothetical protein